MPLAQDHEKLTTRKNVCCSLAGFSVTSPGWSFFKKTHLDNFLIIKACKECIKQREKNKKVLSIICPIPKNSSFSQERIKGWLSCQAPSENSPSSGNKRRASFQSSLIPQRTWPWTWSLTFESKRRSCWLFTALCLFVKVKKGFLLSFFLCHKISLRHISSAFKFKKFGMKTWTWARIWTIEWPHQKTPHTNIEKNIKKEIRPKHSLRNIRRKAACAILKRKRDPLLCKRTFRMRKRISSLFLEKHFSISALSTQRQQHQSYVTNRTISEQTFQIALSQRGNSSNNQRKSSYSSLKIEVGISFTKTKEEKGLTWEKICHILMYPIALNPFFKKERRKAPEWSPRICPKCKDSNFWNKSDPQTYTRLSPYQDIRNPQMKRSDCKFKKNTESDQPNSKRGKKERCQTLPFILSWTLAQSCKNFMKSNQRSFSSILIEKRGSKQKLTTSKSTLQKVLYSRFERISSLVFVFRMRSTKNNQRESLLFKTKINCSQIRRKNKKVPPKQCLQRLVNVFSLPNSSFLKPSMRNSQNKSTCSQQDNTLSSAGNIFLKTSSQRNSISLWSREQKIVLGKRKTRRVKHLKKREDTQCDSPLILSRNCIIWTLSLWRARKRTNIRRVRLLSKLKREKVSRVKVFSLSSQSMSFLNERGVNPQIRWIPSTRKAEDLFPFFCEKLLKIVSIFEKTSSLVYEIFSKTHQSLCADERFCWRIHSFHVFFHPRFIRLQNIFLSSETIFMLKPDSLKFSNWTLNLSRPKQKLKKKTKEKKQFWTQKNYIQKHNFLF